MGANDRIGKERETSRPTRRASTHVKFLLLEAGREVFAEKGYSGASTREIADRAGVAETVLFRNFGSKANLFGEAVLLPVAQVMRDWIDISGPKSEAAAWETQVEYIGQLYRTIAKNKGLLLTFIAASAFEPEVLAGHRATKEIQDAIDGLSAVTETRLEDLGVDPSNFNVGIAVRAVIGMVMSTVLFDSWLMPRGQQRVPRDAVVRELSRQINYGTFNPKPTVLNTEPATPVRRTTARRAPRRST